MRIRTSPLRRVVGWLTTLLVLGFILLVAVTYVISCLHPTPPTIKEAPWLIQTSSRVYYASKYSLVNGVPTITGFWVQDGKGRYQEHKGTMPFPKREFGSIVVIRRKE